MNKVGIIQPNYIPWRGYFDFIDEVDTFIFFDDVQYTKRDWRNRNKIKTANGDLWLTVPVHKHDREARICDVEIDYNQNWQRKHKKSLELNYCKASFFKRYFQNFCNYIDHGYSSIADLDIGLSVWIMGCLDIHTPTFRASFFDCGGSKSDRLLCLLKEVGATDYLSGPAAKTYMEPEKFAENNIGLSYKSYEYLEYPQLGDSYVPNLSVLDLLFNCGPDSRRYLKSCQK